MLRQAQTTDLEALKNHLSAAKLVLQGIEEHLEHFWLLFDGDTLVAAIGPIPVTAEDVWHYERIATSIALKHDFYPDGWELAE